MRGIIMASNISKRKIVFTWDDNSCRHYQYIVPLFEKYGIHCTFYVNPGWKCFKRKFLSGYMEANHCGFEIGSHGLTHKHMMSLSNIEFENQLSMSQQLLQSWLGHSIKTFAFPHHEYSDGMLTLAKKYYLETRNSVPDSIRYSLKSRTTLADIEKVVNETELRNQTLIFSGHSVAINSNEIDSLSKNAGYEPILINHLENIIKTIFLSNSENEFRTLAEIALLNRKTICGDEKNARKN